MQTKSIYIKKKLMYGAIKKCFSLTFFLVYVKMYHLFFYVILCFVYMYSVYTPN